MNKYSYRVFWSDTDECYIATSPEFPRLSAFGDTAQEAIDELGVVLEAAMEIYEEEGWPLPEPQKVQTYSGQFRLRLPKSLHAQLAERAEIEGVSLNTLVVQHLSFGLGKAIQKSEMERDLRQDLVFFAFPKITEPGHLNLKVEQKRGDDWQEIYDLSIPVSLHGAELQQDNQVQTVEAQPKSRRRSTRKRKQGE
jgi:predicted RNase H-like HicB family nuclease